MLFVLAVICALCAPVAVIAADEPAPPPPAAPLPPMVNVPPRPTPTVTCIVQSLRQIRASQIQTLALRLGLSEEDKAKVLNLLTKTEEDSTPLYEAQRMTAEAYAIALTKETTTQAELLAAAAKAMKAESDVLDSKIKTLYALKAMLKPEQNAALNTLLKQYSMQWLPREMRMAPAPMVPVTPPTTIEPAKPAGGAAP